MSSTFSSGIELKDSQAETAVLRFAKTHFRRKALLAVDLRNVEL
jgi:hypothetical protein